MIRAHEWRVRSVALACLNALGACEGAEPERACAEASALELVEPEPLVDPRAWQLTPPERDPLAAHRPELLTCAADSWGEEFGLLEVWTGGCNYFSAEQPLARALERGDPLRVSLWWAALIAPEPAHAHLALLVDGELLWEREVEIPSAASTLALELDSPVSAPAGAPLVLHLHNHGQNSWTFAGLEWLGPGERDCE